MMLGRKTWTGCRHQAQANAKLESLTIRTISHRHQAKIQKRLLAKYKEHLYHRTLVSNHFHSTFLQKLSFELIRKTDPR